MIYLGSDHAGLELKEEIIKHLEQREDQFKDLGTYNMEPFDYALAAARVGDAIMQGDSDLGLLFCGTGVGISIAANKVKGVRAACCSDTFSAKLTRLHNNANILCLGSRVVGIGLAIDIVDIFLDTVFSNEERHIRRIDQITQIENR